MSEASLTQLGTGELVDLYLMHYHRDRHQDNDGIAMKDELERRGWRYEDPKEKPGVQT